MLRSFTTDEHVLKGAIGNILQYILIDTTIISISDIKHHSQAFLASSGNPIRGSLHMPTPNLTVVRLRNRTAERRGRQNALCARHVTGLLLACFVVIFLMFSGLLQKDLSKGQGEVKRKSFSHKIMVTFVTQGFQSSSLFRPVG